jgi:uncharacterized membrane protein YjjP (DUF1212 family)
MATMPGQKPPLDREALRDVIDLSLWAGQLLLQHGAETARIEETVHRLGTGLGADWMDILVSPNSIALTTISGAEFRTKIRRVVAIGVNMEILTEINDLSRQVTAGRLDRFRVRQEMVRIDNLPRQYNRWLVVVMVGLACAAFSRLLEGDWPVFGITFAAASVAMWARQELGRRYFNPLLVTVVTAFVAGIIASTASALKMSNQPQVALAASVLLLVPGVALINCADDLIKGHFVTGIVRGVTGGLAAMGIALGLLLAMRLMGVSGL